MVKGHKIGEILALLTTELSIYKICKVGNILHSMGFNLKQNFNMKRIVDRFQAFIDFLPTAFCQHTIPFINIHEQFALLFILRQKLKQFNLKFGLTTPIVYCEEGRSACF